MDDLNFKIAYYYARVFFSALAQKLKDEKTQTQGKFDQNSRKFSLKLKKPANRGNFGANFDQKIKFQPKKSPFLTEN